MELRSFKRRRDNKQRLCLQVEIVDGCKLPLVLIDLIISYTSLGSTILYTYKDNDYIFWFDEAANMWRNTGIKAKINSRIFYHSDSDSLYCYGYNKKFEVFCLKHCNAYSNNSFTWKLLSKSALVRYNIIYCYSEHLHKLFILHSTPTYDSQSVYDFSLSYSLQGCYTRENRKRSKTLEKNPGWILSSCLISPFWTDYLTVAYKEMIYLIGGRNVGNDQPRYEICAYNPIKGEISPIAETSKYYLSQTACACIWQNTLYLFKYKWVDTISNVYPCMSTESKAKCGPANSTYHEIPSISMNTPSCVVQNDIIYVLHDNIIEKFNPKEMEFFGQIIVPHKANGIFVKKGLL